MRPSCLYCARKHLGKANALLNEARLGYPEHLWLAVGELSEAEDELLRDHPDLASMIRAHRKQLEINPQYDMPVMKILSHLCQRAHTCGMNGLGEEPVTGGQAALELALKQSEAARRAAAGQGATQEHLEANLEEMQEKVQKAALNSAMLQTGLKLGLSLIPGVGKAIATVATVAQQLFIGDKYQKKLENYVQEKTAEIQAYIDEKQKKYEAALNDSYKKAFDQGVVLARSGQTLEFAKEETEEFLDPWAQEGIKSSALPPEPTPATTPVGGPIEMLTGEDAWNKGKKAVDKAVSQARWDIDAATDPIIREVSRSAFQALLAKQIALQLRAMPAAAAAGAGTLFPGAGGGLNVPLIVGAAATALVLIIALRK